MRFDYTEEQRLLAESVRRFVARDYTFEARKRILASPEGASAEAWQAFADMGLLALNVPAEHGGFGGSAADLAAVMEAFGEALVVEPFLATVGLAAPLVARAGSEAQKAALLPRVADGSTKLAFAFTEVDSRYDLHRVATRARREGAGWILEGAKHVVLGAPLADRILVTARTSGGAADLSGVSVFIVEAGAPGLKQAAHRTIDGMRAADLRLQGVRVGGDALVGVEGAALEPVEAVADYATALLCWEAVGAMRYANGATVEYLKTRKQFGVPIGSFQALQHRMVDMMIELEQARSMASLACAHVDGATPAAERRRVVSAAKIKIADACRRISQESVQLHGGMGMTEELKVSHSFRRLTMIAQQLGDADHHLERYARA